MKTRADKLSDRLGNVLRRIHRNSIRVLAQDGLEITTVYQPIDRHLDFLLQKESVIIQEEISGMNKTAMFKEMAAVGITTGTFNERREKYKAYKRLL